jgi:hypothetical protein
MRVDKLYWHKINGRAANTKSHTSYTGNTLCMSSPINYGLRTNVAMLHLMQQNYYNNAYRNSMIDIIIIL